MSPASGEDAGDVGWRRDGMVWACPAAQAADQRARRGGAVGMHDARRVSAARVM
jgi:hypothetical protein